MKTTLSTYGTTSLFIEGKDVPAESGETFERLSPFDGSVLSIHQDGDVADAERAVTAARRSFDSGEWRYASAADRKEVLHRAAELIRDDVDRLTEIVSAESGLPHRGEPLMTANLFEYYGHLAFDRRDEALTEHTPDAIGIIASEPVGVVAMITPWNGPSASIGVKSAPALAAGCSVVVKPSHLAPTAALEIARIFAEAGLPPGVFNVVTSARGGGAEVGNLLASSNRVDAITFTGSTNTGRKIMQAAAGNLKRVHLELGGKSANVVFPDVYSIDDAARAAFGAITMMSGQACNSGSRLVVHESIMDAMVERIAELFRTELRLGDPLDPATNIGPLVSPEQRARVLSYIESGKEEASLVIGGGIPSGAHLAAGQFVEPTIFRNVPVESRISREEIFGPVLSVIPFSSAAEALAIANSSTYGLGAAVWTQDIDLAMRFAKGFRAGTVFVNSYRGSGLANMPFGGLKGSGVGREHGREGIREFLEVKSMHIKLNTGGDLLRPM